MSKSALKKQLSAMTHEQISELVLELYSARKEAKEYLDFYVNPDIDEKLDKARVAITKEMKRKSGQWANPRITRVRKQIKNIATLNPGYEHIAEISSYAVEAACVMINDSHTKESVQRNIAKLLHEAIAMSDKAGMLNVHMARIRKAIDGMDTPHFRSNQLKRALNEAFHEAIASLAAI